MKMPKSHYGVGTFFKYFIIVMTVFFVFVILSALVDKSLERSTRFDCWKFEQYATTYEGFWVTEEEAIACQTLGITIDAEIR